MPQGLKRVGSLPRISMSLDDLMKFERLYEANITPKVYRKMLGLKRLNKKTTARPEFQMFLKYERYYDEQQALKLLT